MSFHVFRSLICFKDVLWFSVWSLALLLHLFLSIFRAVVNQSVFLVSFLGCSLGVYRNRTECCMCISYPELCWTHSLVQVWGGGVWVWVCVPLGFLLTGLCHLQIETVLLHFQSIIKCLLFFLFPNCSGRTSSTMLKRSGESIYPCISSDIRRKAFSVTILSMISTVELCKCPFTG